MKKGIIKGKYFTSFAIIELILTITFFILPKDNPLFKIVFFTLVVFLLISFFNIYNPQKKHRVKFLWKIRLFLFGEPTK